MAEDHRAPGAEEVEVAVSVGVEEVSAFGMSHEGRFAAYGTKGADGGVDASGKEFFGALLQLAGAGVKLRHLVQYKSAAPVAICCETRAILDGAKKCPFTSIYPHPARLKFFLFKR
jgi:hypothetical protein